MWLLLFHWWLCNMYVHWSLLMDLHICAWKSYKSSTSSYCMCSCWFSNGTITWGDMLLSDLICYNCSLLSWSCFELWSLSSLDGTCLVTPIVITHVGLIFSCMTFWGLTSFPHFFHIVMILLQPQMCSFFSTYILEIPLLFPSYYPKFVANPP
jgi:hypothetical protein